MSPALDHIVILVPHRELHALPAWVTDSFTVINGGQHAGGLTENKLILLQDGVYLELIAFVSGGDDGEAGRQKHRWGTQPEGRIIDWALSLAGTAEQADDEFSEIQARVRAADAGLVYGDLVTGGRTTPDGVVLKWATASPAVSGSGSDVAGGLLPFWCLDRTERQLRVPYASAGGSLARHASAAVGVAGVTLYLTDAALLDRLRRVYDAVLARKAELEWELAVPERPLRGQPKARLRLVLVANQERGKEQQQRIELSLFTTGEPQIVGGHFVDGWRIDVRLVKAE